MASCIPGSLVADVRGSVGTETFSRTLGGLIVKARSDPAQPASGLRDQTQANFTAASQGWSGRLSASQRDAWRSYGVRYPRPNRWGNPIIDSGYLAFVRCNCALKIIDDTWWIDVPPELGMLTMPVFDFDCVNIDPDYFIFMVMDTTFTVVQDDYMIVQAGICSNVGVNYYSTPWQLNAFHRWNSGAWVPSIYPFLLQPWAIPGDKAWLRAFVINKITGRLSVHFQRGVDVQHVGKFQGTPQQFKQHSALWWIQKHPEMFSDL